MASFAWLSVIVKSGLNVIHPRTIVKCNWDDRFCSLLTKLKYEQATVIKIEISRTEKFVDPVHIVPMDAPVILCEQFNCYNVCVHTDSEWLHQDFFLHSQSIRFDDVYSKDTGVASLYTAPSGERA